MKLKVNNKPSEFQGSYLNQLLLDINLAETKGIAVAVNNKVISRNEWNTHTLNENDIITIIRATQGG
jgi:sulfur carrier protein